MSQGSGRQREHFSKVSRVVYCLLLKVNNLSLQNGLISTEEPKKGRRKCGASLQKTDRCCRHSAACEVSRESCLYDVMYVTQAYCENIVQMKQIFHSVATLVLERRFFQTCESSGAWGHHAHFSASQTLRFHRSGMGLASEPS